jgi:hypothetical protein
MIQRGTNNKSNGQTAKVCDAGSVVVGRTADNGEYKILKLNSDGSISSNQSTFVNGAKLSSNVPFGVVPIVPAGLKAPNTFLAGVDVSSVPLVNGVYSISPFVYFNATTAPNINIFLVKQNSTLDNYFQTLTAGVSVFFPTSADLQNGLVEFWHSANMSSIAPVSNFFATNQANLKRDISISNPNNDNFRLYIVTDNATTLISGELFISNTLLSKIG